MTIAGPSLPAQAPPHVRAILVATHETLGLLFDCEAAFGEARVGRAQAPRASEVIVVVGFTGMVQGHILLGMSRPTACAMAATLLMELPSAFDDLTRSAMAEIANIVAGSCATGLHRDGYEANISVPSVIVGQRVEVSWPNLYVLETTLQLPAGEVEMAIGLKVERPTRLPAT